MILRYKLLYLFLFIFISSYSGFFVYSEYQRTISEAEKLTQNFAELLALRFEKVFARAESMLDFQAHQYSQDILVKSAVPKNKTKVTANMGRLIKNFPEASAVHISDANGDILYFSEEYTTETNIADRPIFKALKEKPTDDVFFQMR